MTKTFDGIVDGKHIEKWEMTEEEKEAAKKRFEELKKKLKDSNLRLEVLGVDAASFPKTQN